MSVKDAGLELPPGWREWTSPNQVSHIVPPTGSCATCGIGRHDEPNPIDVDKLPPLQYLVMEVLAARWRLGEACWTFRTSERTAVRALGSAGLVTWKASTAPNAITVWLTVAGQKACRLDKPYEPIVKRPGF